MTVIGEVGLPIAGRQRSWDGPGAQDRIFNMCSDGDEVDVGCVSRAFLFRNEDDDPETQAAYSLGFADVIDGQVQIVPRGVAATAGGRGLPAAEGIPSDERSDIQARICSIYDRLQDELDDWPDCPFDSQTAALTAAFQDPGFGGPDDPRLVRQEPERPAEDVTFGAPLTVTDDGEVFGHAALWGRCHVGYSGTCVRPPKEPSSYRGFLVGSADGETPTGPLVVGTGHADLEMSGSQARSWYDDTGTAVADVTVGPDDYGIWAAGQIRGSASPEDVEALRGSALSGDWRPIGGKLKLVALLAVNSPGFRVGRAHALAASGAIVSVGPGCRDCPGGDTATLEERVEALERLAADRLTAGIQ